MNPSNVANLSDSGVLVTATTALNLPPQAGTVRMTAASPVTVSTISAAAIQTGRLVMLICDRDSSAITLAHTAYPGSSGQISLATRANRALRPGESVILRQDSGGAWHQVAGGVRGPYVVESTSGGTSRNVAHGLGYAPGLGPVSIQTAAGAVSATGTVTVDGTNLIISGLANADDIVRAILVP